jgi:hypothetical protein
VHEVISPGWAMVSHACTSQTGASTAFDPDAMIHLAAGDTVTCTFTNRLQPPQSGLALGKVTLGDNAATAVLRVHTLRSRACAATLKRC